MQVDHMQQLMDRHQIAILHALDANNELNIVNAKDPQQENKQRLVNSVRNKHPSMLS